MTPAQLALCGVSPIQLLAESAFAFARIRRPRRATGATCRPKEI